MLLWTTGAGFCVCLLSFVLATSEDVNVDLSCNEMGIGVVVAFEKYFEGLIFSKGYHKDSSCRYLNGENNTKVTFNIPIGSCGTGLKIVNDSWIISNTIVVQRDPLIQTLTDKEVILQCKIERTNQLVTRSLDKSTSDHSVDASLHFSSTLNAEMSVAYVGEKVKALIFMRDSSKTYNGARITNCHASGSRSMSIKLIDEFGCPVRPYIFSAFNISVIDDMNPRMIAAADMVAFRFTDSESVLISCDVELCTTVCESECGLPRSLFKRSLDAVSINNSSTPSSELARLMRSTINALSTRAKAQRYEASNLRKRIDSLEGVTVDSDIDLPILPTIPSKLDGMKYVINDSTVKLRAAASLVVTVSPERQTEMPDYCIPRQVFTAITTILCTVLIVLATACIFMALYIRKEKKRNLINRFLLYSYK